MKSWWPMNHFRKYLQNYISIDRNKEQIVLTFNLSSPHTPQCNIQQQKKIILNCSHSVRLQDFTAIRQFCQRAELWAFITNSSSLYQLPAKILSVYDTSTKFSPYMLFCVAALYSLPPFDIIPHLWLLKRGLNYVLACECVQC